MAIVSERLASTKPQVDPKKVTASQLNNNKDLDVDSKREDASFFASFFSGAKNTPKKKGAAAMDAVGVAHLLARCDGF